MSKKGAVATGAVKLEELPKPDFWQHRLDIFDRLYAEQQAEYQRRKQPIKVTLPDGKVKDGESWITTPLEIAKSISSQLPDRVFVAKVDDQPWDLTRPLEADCKLELLDWEDPEARRTFWHSSAHVLGYAMERVFNCKLSVGPPLEDGGFFYEGQTGRPVSEADYPAVEAAMTELVKAKAPYQRLVIKKEVALEMFNYTEFKSKILAAKVPEGGACTVYKCGSLIDPCRGPHLPDTSRVKAFAVTKNSSSYFEGNADNAVLQRVYAIAFPKETLLKEWKQLVEEAAKRDHRKIGAQQELFMFHDVSPGSAFWLPHGARIYNTLIEFQRKAYRRRGFDEVVTPNIYNAKLWMVSGHWELYKDAMFRTVCEHEDYGLKPMNCPGHCVMFGSRPRSYRELPVRYADFGTLHRNELSGALTGLTRVRRFQQDDAHIFCMMEQLGDEMNGCLDFLRDVYGVFGFNFFLKLSTRPENALGTREVWDVAEARLTEALNAFCNIPAEMEDPFDASRKFRYDGTLAAMKKIRKADERAKKEGVEKVAGAWTGLAHAPWEVNPGDGAFYGPKIDIVVEDALKRKHQCATIQLDFNLPERFGLKYTLPSAKAAAEGEEGEPAAAAGAAAAAAGAAAPAAPATPAATLKPADDVKPQHVDPEHPKPMDHKHHLVGDAPAKPAKELHMHIDKSLDANQARPVMIHRAILGSVERCTAILCEHYGGKWPFWLSPRQVMVVPVSHRNNDYAKRVQQTLHDEGFYADADVTTDKMEKKIRNAQVSQYNLILVVGEEEQTNGTVNIRVRDAVKPLGVKTIDEFAAFCHNLVKTNARDF